MNKKMVFLMLFITILSFSNMTHSKNPFPLKSGSDENYIRRWQKYLNRYVLKQKVNGIYGPKTTKGTKFFQNYVGLKPTGEVNKDTWEEMHIYAFQTYLVKPWDTIKSIADDFNLPVWKINIANIKEGDLIKYQNEIIIPVEKEDLTDKRLSEIEGGIFKIRNNFKNEDTQNYSWSSNQSYIYPVRAKENITSRYGMRNDPLNNTRSFHNGTDFAVKTNTPIRAIANGKVLKSTWLGDFGKTITIDHDNNIVSLYAHNNRLLVKEGDMVKQGDKIALSGNTGRTTGPHLHFSIYDDNKTINPLNFIRNR